MEIFLIVLLHEFGHAIAGLYFNLTTRSITLYPIGGVALMDMSSCKTKEEFIIALSGPAVNFALIIPLWLIKFLFPNDFNEHLFFVNVVILIFNMIPSYPMDGGRVLRATLALLMKNYEDATIIACHIGKFFCILMSLFGVFFGSPSITIIAFFVFFASSSEAKSARQVNTIKDIHEQLTGIKTPPTSEKFVNYDEMYLQVSRKLRSIIDPITTD